jgi:hypothetical protein
MSNGPWTDAENDLIVADYFAMLAADFAGQAAFHEARSCLVPDVVERKVFYTCTPPYPSERQPHRVAGHWEVAFTIAQHRD